MNAQFHTPSLGDEVIYESDGANSFVQSKRMRNMDHSLDEYHSANDESFGNASASLFSSPSPVAAAGTPAAIAIGARKLLTTIDPKEPTKPLSPYALFFRDTVSAIKQQNPNCSFQELKVIVASMWEALDSSHKNVYNKKNELACSDYLKQMRIYRQQQEQQQQMGVPTNDPSNNGMLQSKPAVFTISRPDGDSGNAMANYSNQMMDTSPQQNHFSTTPPSLQPQYMQPQEEAALHPQQQQQQAMSEQSVTANHSMSITTDPSPQQIQMLTEAGSVQKCTRESCTKRAIINPDWEDEYCSNECVVIHCRNVFNTWVQSNLDARKQ